MASIYKQGQYWHITWYENGKKKHKSTKQESRRLAIQALRDFEYQLANRRSWGHGGKIPIQQIAQEYFRQLETRCTEKHIKTQRTRLRQFIDYASIHYLQDIDTQTIDKYLHERKSNGLTDATVKHDYTVLKAFFNWCKKRGYTHENITDQIDPPKIRKRLPRYLEPDQVSDLMAYISSDEYNIPYKSVPVKYIIFVELFSGLRFGRELLRLRKRDIVVDRCEMHVHDTKSGRAKVVPFAPILLELLQPWLDTKNDNELLFPVSQFPRKQWEALCHVLDIDITPYQLKHTFATNFYLQTRDLLALQKILGHTDISTTKIYTQIADEHLKKVTQNFAY